MDTVLKVLVGVVLLGLTLVIAFAVGKLRELLSEIHEVRKLLGKMESDRIDTKCSNLFAQVLRALEKEQVNISTYKRTSSTTLTIHRAEDFTPLKLAVRPDRGAFETGQIIAYADGIPTVHSCQEDMRSFARQIKQAFGEVARHRVA